MYSETLRMKLLGLEELPPIPKLKLAVVGHIEWMNFLSVDKLPRPGIIGHAHKFHEEAAGGGAVVAVKMAQLSKEPVHFFTALGHDELGERSYKQLENQGLVLHVAWRNEPTRRGISMVDKYGERAITVIGERLQPKAKDDLPWQQLKDFDGVFITASDQNGIKHCRKAKVLAATPRVGTKTLRDAKIQLNALISSDLDPDEKIGENDLIKKPQYQIATRGKKGCLLLPNITFKASIPNLPVLDSYGCGDSFAAGVTAGLAAQWDIGQAISLGAHLGAKCTTHLGPYQ